MEQRVRRLFYCAGVLALTVATSAAASLPEWKCHTVGPAVFVSDSVHRETGGFDWRGVLLNFG